jgi:hypothetical protein
VKENIPMALHISILTAKLSWKPQPPGDFGAYLELQRGIKKNSKTFLVNEVSRAAFCKTKLPYQNEITLSK